MTAALLRLLGSDVLTVAPSLLGMRLRTTLDGVVTEVVVDEVEAYAGADDPAAPVEKAEIIRSGILDSRLVVIERAAHIANVERPDEVTREILNHLQTVRKGG